MPVSDGQDEVASLRKQLRHQQQAHREVHTTLKNQVLAIEAFQSKRQMAGQKACAFIAKTRSQSEDSVRAELMAVQRFEEIEDNLQRQYDGQLRSHVHALQDECRDHVTFRSDMFKLCISVSELCKKIRSLVICLGWRRCAVGNGLCELFFAADRRNPRPQSRVEQGRFYW